MSEGQGNNHAKEKVVYVGDSRVKKVTQVHIPRDYSAYPGKSEAFVPNFLLKEWMVGSVVLVGFLVLVMSHPSPLGYPADPLTVGFIPMPDWYFLFLYQLLKYPYTSGDFIIFGTLVLPGLLFGALTIVPFLDTGKERRFYKRPITTALMILSIITASYLTIVSWSHYQHELASKNIVPEHIKREQERAAGKPAPSAGGVKQVATIALVEDKDPAYDIYKKSTCVGCHATDLKGQSGMPSLRGIGDKHSKDEIMNIIRNGYPPGMSGQYEANIQRGLTEQDLDALSTWLALQKQ